MKTEPIMKNQPVKKYPHIQSRRGVWREIVRYVKKDCPCTESLLELGAGYCDFINQFPAETKICYEQNPDMADYADEDVNFRCDSAVTLSGVDEGSIDLVFASNFLEHLTDDEHEVIMPRIGEVLAENGQLILIQPNYNRCKDRYFDDETHQTIFSDTNIELFLCRYDFKIIKLIPGLLPFSMKSRLPKWPFLVRLYLALPFKANAAQMYIIATKR